MDIAVEVDHLVVERGRRRVLHGISARVPRGVITGLLGPSGSGKTTLMRAIVGVQIVKSGTVTVLGLPAGSPALRRRIGYVTQAPGRGVPAAGPGARPAGGGVTVSARIMAATTGRILRQLRHDRRTLALLMLAPPALVTLLYFMLDAAPYAFDRVALTMLGVFPFIIMFLITSIAMLRERTSGTLERLFTTPAGKLDLLFGYGLAFGLLAAVQASVTTAVAYWALDLRTAGPTGLVVLIAVANAVLGMALGLLCSAFARTEFQAVQFMPVVVAPQMLLCGMFVPRAAMAGWLQGLSDAMPMSYSVEALTELGTYPDPTDVMWRDLGIVLGVVVVALVLGAATLRHRTP